MRIYTPAGTPVTCGACVGHLELTEGRIIHGDARLEIDHLPVPTDTSGLSVVRTAAPSSALNPLRG
jgi:hypothetical protein